MGKRTNWNKIGENIKGRSSGLSAGAGAGRISYSAQLD